MQDSQTYTARQQKAKFHLDEAREPLRLFVPQDKRDREVCYLRQLPSRLLRFLGIFDAAAESVVNGIVNARSISIVNEILKDAGVLDVTNIPRPRDFHDNEESNTSDRTPTPTEAGSTRRSPSPPHSRPLSETTFEPDIIRQSSTPAQRPRRQPTVFSDFNPSEPTSPVFEFSHDRQYAALLDRVISAASQMELPEHGVSASSGSRHGLPETVGAFQTIFGARSLDRNNEVGAAGELLVCVPELVQLAKVIIAQVFELLSQLLPDFDLRHWKSTVREYVRVHDKYRDLDPWNGTETADITYDDINNDLSRLLDEKGHQVPCDQDRGPKFYIEVKTTTGDCDEPFYVSGAQYRLVCDLALPPMSLHTNT